MGGLIRMVGNYWRLVWETYPFVVLEKYPNLRIEDCKIFQKFLQKFGYGIINKK